MSMCVGRFVSYRFLRAAKNNLLSPGSIDLIKEMLIDDYFCQVMPAKGIRHDQRSLRPLKVFLSKDDYKTFDYLRSTSL